MKPIESKEEQFNEIIFENRNKEYGAYALRTSYKKRMIIAISFSLAAFLIAVSFPLIAGYLNNNHSFLEDKTINAELLDLPKNTEVTPPPPPPPPPSVDPVKTQKFIAPTIVEMEVETNFGNGETVINKPIDTTTVEKEIVEITEKESIVDEKLEIYTIVQEMPSFPGGDGEWMNFITKNIQYPVMALEGGISGTVYIKFVIEADGNISNISVERSIGGGCDEEALRVIKMLPKWNPGRQNGKAVRVWCTLPIKFSLQ